MLEPGGFTTNNLFPAGKVIKPRCFPNEAPDKEKALARSSFVLEAACGGSERKRLHFLEAPVLNFSHHIFCELLTEPCA